MKVLAVGAHPDDIEIGCGGTIARFSAMGAEVTFVCLTSGEQGSFRYENLSEIREEEARVAAKILGANDIEFYRQPDGFLVSTKEICLKLISLLRGKKPDYVFTHSSFESVPDHLACSQMVSNAVAAASGPWFPKAGKETWQVKALLGFEVWNAMPSPNLTIDITPFMEQKIEALNAHKSQVEDISYVKGIEGLGMYRAAFTKKTGFAEAFEIRHFSNELLAFS